MSTTLTRFRMPLIEQLIEEDSGEFCVEAPTAGAAAAILHQAHDRARDADSDVVTLPDGQARSIDPTNVIKNRVFCILLDADGNEIGEIAPDAAGEAPAS